LVVDDKHLLAFVEEALSVFLEEALWVFLEEALSVFLEEALLLFLAHSFVFADPLVQDELVLYELVVRQDFVRLE
jgi:hypothetical protein